MCEKRISYRTGRTKVGDVWGEYLNRERGSNGSLEKLRNDMCMHYVELILTVVLWFRTQRLILCGDNKSFFRVQLVYFITRNIYCRVRSPSHFVLKSQIVACDRYSVVTFMFFSFFQTRFRLWSSIQMLLLPRLRNWWVTQAWIRSAELDYC